MGGTTVLKDLGEGAAELISKYGKSTESMMEDSNVGKSVIKWLKNEVEPAIGKEAHNLNGQAKPGGGVHDAQSAYYAARDKVHDLAFGTKRQGTIPLLRAVQDEKGPTYAAEFGDALNNYLHDPQAYWRIPARKALVADVMQKTGKTFVEASRDVKFKVGSSYSTQGKAERAIKNVMRPSFLNLVSIPHASQAPLNSLMINGWRASAKAFADFAVNPRAAFDFSEQAGAQSLEAMHEFINQTQGTSMFKTLIDPLRKVFSFERRWSIAFSAVSGKWAAIDAAREFAANQSKWSEIQLKVLGLDPQTILQQGGRLAIHDMEQAAYRAANEIMGFRSPLETPYGWESNGAARLATLYKHYGFRQAKLIKDALFRAKEAEGWAGVAKITATLGSTFFIAGEMIKATEDIVSLKQPWSDDEKKNNLLGSEYLDGIAHAGGFGIIYSTFRSIRHNDLKGQIVGPIVSSATDIIQDAVNLRGAAFTRDILRRFGLPGRAAVNVLIPPKKKKDESYVPYKADKSSNKPYY